MAKSTEILTIMLINSNFKDLQLFCVSHWSKSKFKSSTQNYLSNQYQHDYVLVKKMLTKFYPSAEKVLTFEPLTTQKVEVIHFFVWFSIISYPLATFKMVAQVFRRNNSKSSASSKKNSGSKIGAKFWKIF